MLMLVQTDEAYVAVALRNPIGNDGGMAVLPLGSPVVVVGDGGVPFSAITADYGSPASTPMGMPARATIRLLAHAHHAHCPERLLRWGAACGGGGAGGDVVAPLPAPLERSRMR